LVFEIAILKQNLKRANCRLSEIQEIQQVTFDKNENTSVLMKEVGTNKGC